MADKGSSGGASGARQTKAERQEAARRQRAEIERQIAARKRNRTIGIALVVAAIVAIVAVVALSSNKKTTPSGSLPTTSALLAQAAAAAKTSGCDTVANTNNYQNAPGGDPAIDHYHIGGASMPTPPPLSSYPSTPPASGPHNPTPLGAGVYDSPPDVYQAIHSLEHAGIIIWYSPAIANSPEIARIREFYSQSADVGQTKVIVAPYDYPSQGAAGELPKGVEMAVVAWHRLQSCATPSLAVAYKFATQYELVNGAPLPGQTYIGVAREPTMSM